MRSVRVRQLASPLSPAQAFDRIAGEPLPFFLDSALASPRLARYSFLGCRPFLVLRSTGRHVEAVRGQERRTYRENPFSRLRKLLRRYRAELRDPPVPFTVGAVGYLGYDLCHHIERLPRTTVADIRLPELPKGDRHSLPWHGLTVLGLQRYSRPPQTPQRAQRQQVIEARTRFVRGLSRIRRQTSQCVGRIDLSV